MVQYSLLVPATGLDPATSDPEFQWLSRYRCTRLEPSPRGWNSALGTWPECARICRGRYPSRKGLWALEEARLQGRALLSFRGVVMKPTSLLLAEVSCGGGPSGRHRRGGTRCVMKSLGKQQGNVRCCGFSGARLCRFGGQWEAGWGSGPGAAAGLALRWTGLAVWRVEARGKDQGSGPAEAGTLRLKFREGVLVIFSRA